MTDLGATAVGIALAATVKRRFKTMWLTSVFVEPFKEGWAKLERLSL